MAQYSRVIATLAEDAGIVTIFHKAACNHL